MSGGIGEANAVDIMRQAASQSGLDLDGVALEEAARRLVATIRPDEAGKLTVVDGEHCATRVVDGRAENVPVGDHIRDLARQFGTVQLAPKRAAETTSATIVQDGRFAGRTDGFAKLAHGFAAARDAEARAQADQVIRAGNPWAAGRINRTAQAVIQNTNPELAKRLKADAGVIDPPNYKWK